MNSQNETIATPEIPEGKTTRKELEAAGWVFVRKTGGGETFRHGKTMIKLSAQGFVTKTLLTQKGENNGDLETIE